MRQPPEVTVMRAVWLREFGPPEVLRLEESATPRPGPGEALVRVTSAGVNFHDVNQRAGKSRGATLPLIVGNEGSGVVEALGSDTNTVRVGDRVVWVMHQGTYTTHAVVPADQLVPIADGIDTQLAAALPMQGLMAHGLAHDSYGVNPGDVVLVQAAASGIGGLLCQIAKLRGARVLGTVSRPAKVADARSNGADEVIVRTENVAERVRQLTNGLGANVVYDGVGKDTFQSGLDSLRPRGTIVVYGQASGPIPPVDTTMLSSRGGVYLTRTVLGHFVPDRARLLARMKELFDWVAAGNLRLQVHGVYPLAEAARAHADVESGTLTGKVLIQVG
jgi:NADPH:quinone reductase